MTTAQFTSRKTYPQDWPAYNAAQTAEKDTFVSLHSYLTCAPVSCNLITVSGVLAYHWRTWRMRQR